LYIWAFFISEDLKNKVMIGIDQTVTVWFMIKATKNRLPKHLKHKPV